VAQRNHKILRPAGSGVANAVFLVGGGPHYRTGFHARGHRSQCHIELAGLEHHHFFVRVLVRRVRRHARTQIGQVQFDVIASVRRAVENLARLVRPVSRHRQIAVTVDARLDEFLVFLLGAALVLALGGGQRGSKRAISLREYFTRSVYTGGRAPGSPAHTSKMRTACSRLAMASRPGAGQYSCAT